MTSKKLQDQVLVITGASSGIGLTTAKMAAARGARVVLTARTAPALREASEAIRSSGGQASFVAADVSDPDAMLRVAQHAVETYGRIDAWVNNAGIGIYGFMQELPLEDMRRVFDVTFWGVVHGSRAAVPQLAKTGGVLINVGSVVSDAAVPLIGMYAAAKHAVKAYTDVLRMELEKQRVPVSVTLIKPGSIDTPFFAHAANYMEAEPAPPPPVYAPELVAETILAAAEHPRREVFVGGAAKVQATLKRLSPRMADRVFERTLFAAQKSGPARRAPTGALYHPGGDGHERGPFQGMVRSHSAYSAAVNHPFAAMALGLLIGVSFATLGLRSGV